MGSSEPKILLVDDEQAITDSLTPLLQHAGFEVAVAADGEQALRLVGSFGPDLIVLDVVMPRQDGRQVLRRLRQAGNSTPVILLTRVGESAERAMALEEGADDYLNKPFDPSELVARVRAVLRRGRPDGGPLASAHRLVSGDLTLDRQARLVRLRGQELDLRPKSVALLDYLLTHPGELLSRERLLDAVWGWDYVADTRAVDNQIYELRRMLNDSRESPRYIETVSGQGYRYISPVEVSP